MEAIGSGASVLAFIGIALKSTESIYQAISAIKDAPEKLQRLHSAVGDLQNVLIQLKALPLITQPTHSTSALKLAIKKCNDDVTSLRDKLSSLTKSVGEQKLKVAWKRVKAVLDKEDLQDIWTTVHHHVTVLNLHLGVIQSNATTHQTQSISAVDQALQTQFSHIVSNTQNIENHANAMASLSGQLTHFEGQSTSANNNTEQTLGRIEQKVDAMPSLSQFQFDTIKSMLEQLSLQQSHLARSAPCSAKTQDSSENTDSDSSANTRPGSDSDSDLNTSSLPVSQSRSHESTPSVLPSIRRLSKLFDKREKTVGSSEAVEIIADLQMLLDAVRRAPPAVYSEKRKRDDWELVTSSDAKRVRGLLDTTYNVKVNNEKSLCRIRDSTQYFEERNYTTVLVNEGSVSLRTRTKWLKETDSQEILDNSERLSSVLEFAANLTFMPSLPELKMKLAASFYQRMMSDGGYFVIPPMLSIHVMIPDNSEIFNLIKNNDLPGTVDMLEQGRASLRDCDTQGRSLLSHACSARSADICRFLVERGADVDALEIAIDGGSEEWRGCLVPPLMQAYWSTCGDRTPYQCNQILLKAGADLQQYFEGSGEAGLKNFFYYALMWDCGNIHNYGNSSQEPLDIKQKDSSGMDILLFMLHREDEIPIQKGPALIPQLKALHSLGADFQAQDIKGDTALQFVAETELGNLDEIVKRRFDDIVDTLTTLIRNGADVHKRNSAGETALDQTCRRRHLLFDPALRARVWIKALQASGHDPATFQILVDIFPDLRPNNADQTGQSQTDDEENRCSEGTYSVGDYDRVDDSPERSSVLPSARPEAQPRTFWAVIDHAVEQEGNPWM